MLKLVKMGVAFALMCAVAIHAEDKKPEAKPDAKAETKDVKVDAKLKEAVEGWKKAVASGDLDKVMGFYSENFKHFEYGDKKGMRDFLNQAKEAHYLDGIEVDTAKTEYKPDGDKATVYPIDLKGSFGAITMELKFLKEKTGWLIVGSDASGI